MRFDSARCCSMAFMKTAEGSSSLDPPSLAGRPERLVRPPRDDPSPTTTPSLLEAGALRLVDDESPPPAAPLPAASPRSR